MTEYGDQVTGLLLAAGGGRRLGGRPKALLEHRGRTLAEHAVRALRASGCARVHVVVGARADTVRARAALDEWDGPDGPDGPDGMDGLDGRDECVLVDNPDWERGMGTSLRAGLDSLAGTGARAALVCLVDQPGIGAAAMARVRAAFRDETSLVSAAYDGVRGHPVLLGAAHWAGVTATATGDRGARAYLKEHAGQLTLVECADVAQPYDIDTEADLGHLE
ncbi:nucleotidyltransferase family protein [Streptomyces sp. NPDC023723]|uniref:nucleotidyltransferase family protein n=1 Tax=Streptomyces sp. NPDC023723 TaxID=3154323 RepID=UPI0033F078C0